MDAPRDQPQATGSTPAPAPESVAIGAARRAGRLALLGVFVNVALALAKLAAGVLGNAYALIADAIESMSDILGSAIVYGGVRVGARAASSRHPYGYGKAESLAGLIVAAFVLVAGVLIGVEAVREIITPHHAPAWWTLLVLVLVVLTKEAMFRLVERGSRATETSGESSALKSDAWHHRADAITSAAAFVGIAVALVGGPGWEPADDWAALLASGVIVFNAVKLMIPPIRELLDATDERVAQRACGVAGAVPGVSVVQKAFARKSGTRYYVDMHVWVEATMTVAEAHALVHRVKAAVRADQPAVEDCLIHVEPDSPRTQPSPGL